MQSSFNLLDHFVFAKYDMLLHLFPAVCWSSPLTITHNFVQNINKYLLALKRLYCVFATFTTHTLDHIQHANKNDVHIVIYMRVYNI